MIDLQKLPSEPDKLKAIISLQIKNHQKQIKNHKAEIQSKDTVLQFLEAENKFLQEALRLARMARFAAQSEKLPSGQTELFNEAEQFAAVAAEALNAEPEESIEVPGHSRVRPKRKPLPDHLPREDIIIDLTDAEKICDKDGTPLKEIGADVSEQLDIIPARMKVIRIIRKKYACPCCSDTIKTAALPEKILPKSNATPGLLAHIAVSKYVDALPLYRQEQIFKRADIDIPRNTMASWMIALSEKLQPIYNLMEEDLISSDYVCCDETRVQVLNEPGKTPQSLSYMWVRTKHGPKINPIVLFDYDPTRSGEVPKKLLLGFKGHLQVDGYVGYDAICRNKEVIRVGCMTHVRRNFFDAYKVSEKKDGPAYEMLEMMKGLYKIEAQIENLSIEERKQIRQEKSKPILDDIKTWLDGNQPKYPPQGLLGKAISYAQNQWVYVIRYIDDGKLSIDNNFTENRIRPFAVGRKNWLFSDSVAGAKASAMIYSILQTARGNGLEPYAYMRHLLTEIPKCQTTAQLENILPHTIDFKVLK